MDELALKYGCNPNQKPARIFMEDGGALPVEGGAFSVEVGPGDVAFVHIGKWPEK